MADGGPEAKSSWWQKPVAIITGLTALVGAVVGLLQAFDSPVLSRIAARVLGEDDAAAPSPEDVVPAAGTDDARWIGDRRTGCKVFNPNPLANEAIEWSGPCVDGRAHGNGVLTWYQDGAATGLSYQGEYKNGMRDGFGTETLWEGSPERSYSGEFRANERNGHGIVRWDDGSSWEGLFVGGLPNGWGSFTGADGATSQRQYVDGKLTAERG